MKKLLTASVFACLSLTIFAGQPVHAAKLGRGKIITVPKQMRGTWYSYDAGAELEHKVVFTKHTFTNKYLKNLTLYHQLTYKFGYTIVPETAKQKAKNKQILRQTKHWGTGRWVAVKPSGYFKGHFKAAKFLEVGQWTPSLGEYFPMYHSATAKIGAKKVPVLVYYNIYTLANYYPTKALAKKYRHSSVGPYVYE